MMEVTDFLHADTNSYKLKGDCENVRGWCDQKWV